MSAAASLSDLAAIPRERAEGAVRLSFRERAGKTALATLYQKGCLKARFPRPERADWPETLLLNVSGGVAGGDRLSLDISLAEGAHAIIAAPAAERFYRALALDVPARVANTMTLAPGAHLDWLPQESILFNGCALSRGTTISLAGDAVFVGVEMLIFGRAAMGEHLQSGDIRDVFRIYRDGRLQLYEATRLAGDITATLRGRATGGGAAGTALLVYAGNAARARLETLRDTLAGIDAGVSLVLPDLLLARILAPDTLLLRRAVMMGLQVLRDGRTPPRVWQG